MYTIIVTFTLTDLTEARYREVCAELAPAFHELPGLIAKIWLTGDRYGGVYLFADEPAADAYLASGLHRTVRTSPHFTGIDVQRFGVDEESTRRTQPGLDLVVSAGRPA